MAERLTLNQEVAGSNPALPTNEDWHAILDGVKMSDEMLEECLRANIEDSAMTVLLRAVKRRRAQLRAGSSEARAAGF